MYEALFSSEWKRGTDAIARFSSSWARDADEREELVQLTWALAWEKRALYRGDGDFVGWLLRLGRTVCTRESERRRRERLVLLSDAAADAECLDGIGEIEALARQDRDDRLLSVIVGLAPHQRAALIAHHGFGYSVKEIAGMTGRSAATVKATLAQARRRLRLLGEEFRGGGRLTHSATRALFKTIRRGTDSDGPRACDCLHRRPNSLAAPT